jgi:glycine cleavage system aminomethyltransferase T
VMGPSSRTLLGRVMNAKLDDDAFPRHAIRPVTIGYATTWAARRSYMGELGWELYIPSEVAVAVYEALCDAGRDLGLRDAGYYAVESLRIEKGYRAWGRELTPDVNPYEAGLGFAVRLDRGDFIGREALLAAEARPRTKRLVCLLGPEPDGPMAWGGEAIAADGRPVGEVTSAGFGAVTDRVVALAYVSSPDGAIDAGWLDGGRFEIDIAGVRAPVRVSLKPPYDPTSSRIRM